MNKPTNNIKNKALLLGATTVLSATTLSFSPALASTSTTPTLPPPVDLPNCPTNPPIIPTDPSTYPGYDCHGPGYYLYDPDNPIQPPPTSAPPTSAEVSSTSTVQTLPAHEPAVYVTVTPTFTG